MRISGAEEPRAMRVRLATVGFHTGTLTFTNSCVTGFCCITTRFEEVITSIDLQLAQHRY